MVISGYRDVFGFVWNPAALPPAPVQQTTRWALVYFQRQLPEFVWDAAALEGNPYTFPEVKTLVEGTAVGGHKVSDEAEVQGLIHGSRELARLVAAGEFELSVAVSNRLHRHVGHTLVLDEGMFRGTGAVRGTPSVVTGQAEPHYPPATEPGGENLLRLHAAIVAAIREATSDPWQQALLYNMAGCFAQFYFDANKRTSRLMMNGHLMAHGYEPISIPARERHRYNTVMVDAYVSGDATAALAFIGNCHERHVRAAMGRPEPPTVDLDPTAGYGNGVAGPTTRSLMGERGVRNSRSSRTRGR